MAKQKGKEHDLNEKDKERLIRMANSGHVMCYALTEPVFKKVKNHG